MYGRVPTLPNGVRLGLDPMTEIERKQLTDLRREHAQRPLLCPQIETPLSSANFLPYYLIYPIVITLTGTPVPGLLIRLACNPFREHTALLPTTLSLYFAYITASKCPNKYLRFNHIQSTLLLFLFQRSHPSKSHKKRKTLVNFVAVMPPDRNTPAVNQLFPLSSNLPYYDHTDWDPGPRSPNSSCVQSFSGTHGIIAHNSQPLLCLYNGE